MCTVAVVPPGDTVTVDVNAPRQLRRTTAPPAPPAPPPPTASITPTSAVTTVTVVPVSSPSTHSKRSSTSVRGRGKNRRTRPGRPRRVEAEAYPCQMDTQDVVPAEAYPTTVICSSTPLIETGSNSVEMLSVSQQLRKVGYGEEGDGDDAEEDEDSDSNCGGSSVSDSEESKTLDNEGKKVSAPVNTYEDLVVKQSASDDELASLRGSKVKFVRIKDHESPNESLADSAPQRYVICQSQDATPKVWSEVWRERKWNMSLTAVGDVLGGSVVGFSGDVFRFPGKRQLGARVLLSSKVLQEYATADCTNELFSEEANIDLADLAFKVIRDFSDNFDTPDGIHTTTRTKSPKRTYLCSSPCSHVHRKDNSEICISKPLSRVLAGSKEVLDTIVASVLELPSVPLNDIIFDSLRCLHSGTMSLPTKRWNEMPTYVDHPSTLSSDASKCKVPKSPVVIMSQWTKPTSFLESPPCKLKRMRQGSGRRVEECISQFTSLSVQQQKQAQTNKSSKAELHSDDGTDGNAVSATTARPTTLVLKRRSSRRCRTVSASNTTTATTSPCGGGLWGGGGVFMPATPLPPCSSHQLLINFEVS
ncbi:unnamed protein product [Taenia asiatica]|uniref:Histone-lysine N-methyltransferase n=1 Tax=Taenia asiatica TaxID=60517 RepID=A0A0R3W933_TAEAS|nr:unnamed protein product [Taenia asiatica]